MHGDCHYLEGNVNAKRRVKRAQEILKEIGLEPERVRMVNISSAMGAQFAELAQDMVEQVRSLGPNPLKAGRTSDEEGRREA